MAHGFQWFASDMKTVCNIWTEEKRPIAVRQPVVGKHVSAGPTAGKTPEARRGGESRERRRQRSEEAGEIFKCVYHGQEQSDDNRALEMPLIPQPWLLVDCENRGEEKSDLTQENSVSWVSHHVVSNGIIGCIHLNLTAISFEFAVETMTKRSKIIQVDFYCEELGVFFIFPPAKLRTNYLFSKKLPPSGLKLSQDFGDTLVPSTGQLSM